MRPCSPCGVKVRTRVESGSLSRKFTERHDWTTSVGSTTARIAPEIMPSKALNGAYGCEAIVTGAPVIAACLIGSRYVAKRTLAGAGRTIDCLITLLVISGPLLL
jgi:hypothetical protein